LPAITIPFISALPATILIKEHTRQQRVDCEACLHLRLQVL
jgi:hypothetical protein